MSSAATSSPSVPAASAGEEFFCPSCGYSLRGISSDRCPECGLPIDRSQLAESQIPWSHRRRIGRFRAYWRTVWFCTFHRRRLADQVARPLSYSDAQRFRFVTVAIIAAPVLLAVPFLPAGTSGAIAEALLLPGPLAGWILPLLLTGIVLSLVVVTGAPSYFFHPKSLSLLRQDRGITLSYYMCAPLAPAALVAYAWIGMLFAAPLIPETFFKAHATLIMASLSAPPCAAAILVLYFLWNAVTVLRASTQSGAGRAALLLLAMLGSAAIVGPALVLGLPWIVAYIYWLARG